MNAPLRPSLRDGLADPRTRPPHRLDGLRRLVFLADYGAIHVFVALGLAHTAAWSPVVLVVALALAYVVENVLFGLSHVGLHASFVETPEAEMTTITHHSFIHHYRNIRVYHQTWLESRMAYFVCPRVGLRTLTSVAFVAAPLASAAVLSVVDWRLAVAGLSSLWAAHCLQAVCHEWVHHDQRASFYWAPTRWLLSGLERVGLLSTAQHRRRHRHHLHSLDAVHDWLDLRLPGVEGLAAGVWRRVLALHVPGERRMTTALIPFFRMYVTVAYALFIVALGGLGLAVG